MSPAYITQTIISWGKDAAHTEYFTNPTGTGISDEHIMLPLNMHKIMISSEASKDAVALMVASVALHQ